MLGLVEGFEVYMRCSLVDVVALNLQICFGLILVVYLRFAGYKQPRVIHTAHACSKVVIQTQVSVKIPISKININGSELVLDSFGNRSHDVPGQDRNVIGGALLHQLAVAHESSLWFHLDQISLQHFLVP